MNDNMPFVQCSIVDLFRDVKIRGFRSAADCMNDWNHRRAAAPHFLRLQHSSCCERTQR
jgi:hypothetical protein